MRPGFLIVEDDALVARSLAHLVDRLGGEPVVAATASRASVALAVRADWRGLLVDVRLPDGNGLDVLEAALPTQPLPRVLVLAGDHDALWATRACALGALYLPKPVRFEVLEGFVARLVNPEPDVATLLEARAAS